MTTYVYKEEPSIERTHEERFGDSPTYTKNWVKCFDCNERSYRKILYRIKKRLFITHFLVQCDCGSICTYPTAGYSRKQLNTVPKATVKELIELGYLKHDKHNAYKINNDIEKINSITKVVI